MLFPINTLKNFIGLKKVIKIINAYFNKVSNIGVYYLGLRFPTLILLFWSYAPYGQKLCINLMQSLKLQSK